MKWILHYPLTKTYFNSPISGLFFQTFAEYIQNSKEKVVILRHDVDRLPGNSLKTARLEDEMGIRATYFFRAIPQTFKPLIIRKIAEYGHEIGYHYENLSEISKKNPHPRGMAFGFHRAGITQINADEGKKDFLWKARMNRMIRMVGWKQLNVEREEIKERLKNELFELAICDFRLNLEKLRELCPVKTICMHGSPLSKWDNRDLWKRYNYQDYGIIGEPYFDVDFDKVLYLTDTGRRWDGERVSVRDKVAPVKYASLLFAQISRGNPSEMRSAVTSSISRGKEVGGLRFRKTWDIIEAAEKGLLPDKVMLNIHPQRWDDKPWPWVKKLVWQNVKNVIKKHFYVSR